MSDNKTTIPYKCPACGIQCGVINERGFLPHVHCQQCGTIMKQIGRISEIDALVSATRDLIRAAKLTCQRWDAQASNDSRAKQLIDSIFDPRFRPVDHIGLREALMKIEDLLQKPEGQADGQS